MNDDFLQWFHAKQDEALERLKREDPGCKSCAMWTACPCGCGFGWCEWAEELADDAEAGCGYEEFEWREVRDGEGVVL